MPAAVTASFAERAGATGMPSATDISVANAAAASPFGSNTVARRMERTTHTASSCVRAWRPAPMTAAVSASGRASRAVAAPDAAPVRRAVSAAPSITARGRPVSASSTTTSAWARGRLRDGLSPYNAITLTDNVSEPDSQAGITSTVRSRGGSAR